MSTPLRAIVAVALLAGLLYLVDLPALWVVMMESAWGVIIGGSLACFLTNLTLLTIRWRSLLTQATIAVPFWSLWRIQLRGTFINTIVPGSIGGDAYKLLVLSSQVSHPKALIITSLLADRVSGLVAILLLGTGSFVVMPGLWSTLHALHAPLWVWLGLFASISASIVIGWYTLRTFGSGWGLRARMEVLSPALWAMGRPSVLVKTLSLSTLIALIGALWLWLCLLAGGATVSFTIVLLAFCITQIIASIPISIQGLGVAEGVMIFLLGLFGVPAEVTLAAALSVRGSLTLLSGMGYLILLAVPSAGK
jgi:uncharacterized membrane protein YbhN (UPF0104 family)